MSELADIDVSFLDARQGQMDKNLYVRFFVDAVQDLEKTTLEGRPIFRDAEMVEIRVRGDRNNIVIREVTPQDKKRFKAAYADFKSDGEKLSSGTPLSQWPAMSRSMVEELKYLGFRTVEDVAAAEELAFNKVMGLRAMAEKAKYFLEQAKGLAPLDTLQAKVDELAATVAAQAEMIKRQEEALAKSAAKK